jgi:tetratricopeptide (TPR) repeat protein
MKRAVTFVLVTCGGAALAGDPHAGHGATGSVDFKVHCTPAVQADFDRALALLHHMTYPQARAAFREIAARDPKCAMAHWGVASTLFQPLWPTRPDLAERTEGWNEVQRARAIGTDDRREQLFIDAAAAFFEDPASEDPAFDNYWARIERWADASARVHAAFPQDADAAAFHALAVLATTPQDRATRANADEAAAILAPVLARSPDHPGAMHYLVHADDVPGRERETPNVVHRYEDVAPDNPHALHMPTHVYTRQGDWAGVVRGNLRAADAALRYPAGDRGEFVWDEFPHAIEYLVYAYLQEGDIANAVKQRNRLLATQHLQPSFKTAFHLASVQARIPLETGDWKAAAAIAPRTPAWVAWDKFPWPEAIAQFAHGLGSARIGERDATRTALARLQVLEANAASAGESLFERNIRVLRLELEGAIALAEQHPDAAIAKLQAAAQLEADTPKHAVTPGPTLPAEELLAQVYLDNGQRVLAHDAYARSLVRYPRRRNAARGADGTTAD